MTTINNTDYLFLSAYIRAREVNLLGRKRLEQMVEAADFDEAAQVLIQCGYPELAGASDAQLEEAFQARRAAVLKDMETLCPEKQLVTAFRLKYDYHNAKVLVKSGGAGSERLFSPCGRVSPEVLIHAYSEDSWRLVPSPLADAIQEARSALARTGNPQLTDMGLDRAYFAELLSITETLSDGFYTGYVRLTIDIANLRSAVRCLRAHMDESILRSALIEGGNIDPQRIARQVYSEGVTAVFDDRAMAVCVQLGQAAVDGAPLAGFERACDDALTAYLAGAKMVSFGPAVAVAYLASLEGEIVAARMLLLGKRAGLGADILRERLRESYG